MKFDVVNGKIVRVDESTLSEKQTVSKPSNSPIIWNLPTTTFSPISLSTNAPLTTPSNISSKPLQPNHPNIMSDKKGTYARSSIIAGATLMTAGATLGAGTGAGVFWDAFLTYIFPWLMDIAKVYCAIKIAQAFYQENNGGSKGGSSGMASFVTYGKWYLLFWLIPWGVELIDQIGAKMFSDLTNNQ